MTVCFRLLLLLLISLALPIPGKGQVQTLTLNTGQKVKVTLIVLTGDNVHLALENGRMMTIKLDQLSPVDRLHVQNSGSGRAGGAPPTPPPFASPASPAPLKLAWTKDRVGSKLQPTDKTILDGGNFETWVCHFELTNTGRPRLEGLQLYYEIHCRFKSQTGGTDGSIRTFKGVLPLSAIEGFRSAKVDTPQIRMSAIASKDIRITKEGRSYDSGRRNLSVEEIEGVVVTIVQSGTSVFRYVSPGLRDTVGP
ncbi:MAG: hypothetical protein ACAH88_17860 [Roseimicrobium sp.]